MFLTFGINKFPGCIIFLFYPLKCCLFKLYNSNILFVGRIIEFDSLQHFLTFVRKKKKWYTHEKEEEWREILGGRLSLSRASVVSWPTLE